MTDRYDRARDELYAVRAELDDLFQQVLDAAEEKHPGITEALDALHRREETLRTLAIQAWVNGPVAGGGYGS